MKAVRTNKAPAPLGPYEQAIIHDGLVYVAMQLPLSPEGESFADQAIDTQTGVLLDNIRAILEAAGSDLEHVLKVMIYLTDITSGKEVNSIYDSYFSDHKPARGVIGVASLPLGHNIAMDVIAAQKSS
jgi:2-iminobutanoate/2-iminopropanoate deaminase